MKLWILSVLVVLSAGCAKHRLYGGAELRNRTIEYKRVALQADGLTAEEIAIISSTQPPEAYPVDIAIIILKNGYIDRKLEDMFAYDLIQTLNESERIGRVTLIPDFLVPDNVTYGTIQELGVRSLSEYVLVFNLDAWEFLRWTVIATSKFEVNSSISFILVDSGTTALMTADQLHSTQVYHENLFKLGEQEKTQKTIFSEQAKLLGKQMDELFDSE